MEYNESSRVHIPMLLRVPQDFYNKYSCNIVLSHTCKGNYVGS